jgi:ATP-dependent Clp protease adaptor protein ClpS
MSEIIEKETTKQALKPPGKWNVVFFNDDFTTVEFVIDCLRIIFGKTPEQGYMIAMQIHQEGKGVVDQYTKDVALTKQIMAQEFAQQSGHPLKIEIEPV